MVYAGLDVHKRQITYCLLNEAGDVTERGELPCRREPIARFADRLGPNAAVALETTMNSQAIAGLLAPRVSRVVVANPLKVRAIAEARIKTDKVDAETLAQLLRCDYLPSVWVPDEPTRQKRQLSARRSALIKHRNAAVHRIHSLLIGRLIPVPKGKLLNAANRAWLEGLDLEEIDRAELESELRVIDAFQREIDQVDQQIAEHAHEQEQVRLLMSLPGVGQQVAISLLAAWGDWRRFKSPDHAASYLGLTPSTQQSGPRRRHGPITKAGRSHTRSMLIQAAQSVGRQQNPIGAFFRKKARRKNRNVAAVATARKLAVIAWHVLSSGEPYRYAPPRSTASKLARLRVQATGERRRGQHRKRNGARSDAGTEQHPASPLNRVYSREQMPRSRELDELPPGERRMLEEHEWLGSATE